jgi:DNA-binding transcriptional LysR family regulator
VVQAVVDGVADVGIIADSTDSGPLQTYPFRQDHLVAVLSKKHPLARRKSLAFSELLGRISSDCPATARCNSTSPAMPPARAGACNTACGCAVSMASAAWWSTRSAWP